MSGGKLETILGKSLYHKLWTFLTKWFRVPQHPPTLPSFTGNESESFKPAPGFLKYLKVQFIILLLIVDIAIFIGWVAITIAIPLLGIALIIPALIIAIIPDIIAYVAMHLRYDTTWYVMNNQSLRIRRGIWTICETTLTFENVQNVKVNQGPLQRFFGISNLIVETAGSGGGSDQNGHATANQGIIEGIANAPQLRDIILKKLRSTQSSGLGDEDHDAFPTALSERVCSQSQWTDTRQKQYVQVLIEIRDGLTKLQQ